LDLWVSWELQALLKRPELKILGAYSNDEEPLNLEVKPKRGTFKTRD